MNLLEYEAKNLLTSFSIPVPEGQVLQRGNTVPDAPIVLKSQVHSGGRGKAGGVKVIHGGDTATTAESIFDLEINGELPQTLLAEDLLDISREYYLSLVIDRLTASIEVIAHQDGGIEIESHDSNEFFRHSISPTIVEEVGHTLADFLGLASKTDVIQGMLTKLLDCFIKNDATLLEINPLVLTADGELVAGDCKMTLDDAAGFRHPEWKFEMQPADANFVTLDKSGMVATIANGAGLAMATVDSVAAAGLTPANFLDIGGGANEASVTRAFERIMEYPQVRGIVINIFAGITRCDEVARAIIAATKNISGLPPLFIRLEGTNYELAKQLLDQAEIPLLTTLEDCIVAMKRETV